MRTKQTWDVIETITRDSRVSYVVVDGDGFSRLAETVSTEKGQPHGFDSFTVNGKSVVSNRAVKPGGVIVIGVDGRIFVTHIHEADSPVPNTFEVCVEKPKKGDLLTEEEALKTTVFYLCDALNTAVDALERRSTGSQEDTALLNSLYRSRLNPWGKWEDLPREVSDKGWEPWLREPT